MEITYYEQLVKCENCKKQLDVDEDLYNGLCGECNAERLEAIADAAREDGQNGY